MNIEEENAKLREALADMVSQHCDRDGELNSLALSANADAMRLLADLGLLEITHEAGRRVLGKWTEEKK